MSRTLFFFIMGCLVACTTAEETDAESGEGGSGGQTEAGGEGGVGGEGGAIPVDCEGREGSPSGADALTTAGGIEYNVRVPADYDPTRSHPLIVVFSPRVQNDSASALEAFTGLGPDATARGYVIAFAEWFDPVNSFSRQDGDTIRVDVAASWCIDAARVFYTGHSDGGSTTTILTLSHDAPVAAVAPSAAGIPAGFITGQSCDNAVPALVIHSADDELFPVPNHGIGAANFWADCAGCSGQGGMLADGCVPYTGCDDGGEVIYCETTGSHYSWYGLNASMLDFFDRHERPLSL